jgi:uncharacterized membrane protein YeaQ/YmgE (transglycosylase-associated protein family)
MLKEFIGLQRRERIHMGLISWIVVGAIAGYLADMVMGSKTGVIMMVVLGIVGGLVGGYVATLLFKNVGVNGINIESIVVATIGAIAVVFVVGRFGGSRGFLRR